MKIKIIKKDRVIDKEIVVLTAIAGIALGNLLYNISTKDNGYVNINGEYWISEESYEEYEKYEKYKSSAAFFLSAIEDKKYPVYEFQDDKKYVYGYINQEYYYNGKLIKKNVPVYDFCSNKELVKTDGSDEENVEEKIKIR